MASTKNNATAQSIIIFGAGGDLCRRKLIPALYNLFLTGNLPGKFFITAVDHNTIKEDAYKKHLLEGINEFSRTGKADKTAWKNFSSRIHYQQGDFTDPALYSSLSKILDGHDSQTRQRSNRLFYFSVSPRFIEIIADGLYKNKIAAKKESDRIIIEKPFGSSLQTAKKLNAFLLKRFAEKQLYRIDHYLGKETVQNMMAFRFANYIFEPLWNKDFIDHVQVSVAETVSIGSRAGYYEQAGAIRDMIQNHLLQLFCVVAMEAPKKLDATEIRNKKLQVLKAIRPFTKTTATNNIVRAQYTEGTVKDIKQVAYRDEQNVAPASVTETYFAGKFFIDNPRWQGVPFYIRTGKCLSKQASVIVVQFKNTPHKIFKGDVDPNRLIIYIQPDNEISLWFESKVPGLEMKLQNVEMDFTYRESYTEQLPEAYEALLLDAMEGDASLFMRNDQVEIAWKIVMPVITNWQKQKSTGLKFYAAGSDGPKAADELLKKDGRKWYL
jgi:glucose-6-phosphate 1-dehydrogenase